MHCSAASYLRGQGVAGGVLLLGALALAPPGVRAQETAASDEVPVPEKNVAETITVTAEKREEDVQRVGIAITVFTDAEIERERIRQLPDLAPQTPNLDVKQTFGNTNPVITIRGVGLNDFSPNNNPAIPSGAASPIPPGGAALDPLVVIWIYDRWHR